MLNHCLRICSLANCNYLKINAVSRGRGLTGSLYPKDFQQYFTAILLLIPLMKEILPTYTSTSQLY